LKKIGHRIDRLLAGAGLVCIWIYFFRLTRPALRAGFSPDDLMNLYRGWVFPLSSLIKANLLFFLPSDFIRPFAEAWYRAIYFFAGFRPAPFHAFHIALLLANIFLVYSLARRLADSRFAALLTALLFAYQERWTPAYFDTGYIFDVLCGLCLFAALLLYIRIRQQGREPSALEYAAVGALYICALNSKEIAAAFAVAIAIYELLFERHRRFAAAAISTVIALAFIVGRATALTSNQAYTPQFTLSRFLDTTAHFANELAAHDWFAGATALAVPTALLLAAVLLRSKPSIYAWAFTAATALPLAFVPPRNGPQYYIPFFGCALYAASMIALAWQRFTRVRPVPFWAARFLAAALLIAIAWPIYSQGKYVALRGVTSITEDAPVIMSLSRRLREYRPSLPSGARLLFLHDPVAPNLEDLLFNVRLTYRNRTIEVDRLARLRLAPSPRQMQAYEAVFDYGASGLVDVPQPPLQLAPRILKLFDSEWKPITAAAPAKPGSRIIALAADLGPTDPDVAPSAPFPRDPFAQPLARINVTVNGVSVPSLNKLGQPGEVNVYRCDFLLPKQLPPGPLKIQISAAGYLSPAAELSAVR
jgi:hypothetical protein